MSLKIGSVCLVTGGAGFIGCAISHLLASRFERYVVFDNLHPQVHNTSERPNELHDRAELFIGDVTAPGDWKKLLESAAPTHVIHLAAETGTGQSLSEASRHGLVNVVGTTQMLDALSKADVKLAHLLLSSSRAVYGEGAWHDDRRGTIYPGPRSHEQLSHGEWEFAGARPLRSRAADTHPSPTSVYAATKLAQEHIIRSWALAQGVPISILRLQNVYGPGQSLYNSYTGIVALFARLAKAGDVIQLYEDGQVTRDFVYIEDVATAFERALLSAPRVSRLADIGSGQPVTILTMAEMVARMYEAPQPRVCGKFRDGDVRHAMCLIDDAREELAWEPQWPLEKGLQALKDWIAEKL
jgi:dTDP-L-rhamnose 4-epimerase